MFSKKTSLKKLSEEEVRKQLYGGVESEDYPESSVEQLQPPAQETMRESMQELPQQPEQSPRDPKPTVKSSKKSLEKPLLIFAAVMFVAALVVALLPGKKEGDPEKTALSKPAIKQVKPVAARETTGETAYKPYTIQVAVYKNEVDAARAINRLKSKGFSPYAVEAKSKKGSTRYRIYVGAFSTSSEGKALLEELKSKHGLSDSFLRKR